MSEQSATEPSPTENDTPERTMMDEITGVGGRARAALLVPALAVLTALLIGGLIIAVTDVDILRLWGNDPGEAFKQTLDVVGGAYKALFVGSLGSVNAVSETLFAATPLILAGLAVAVGFQAGLFNIGVEGQMVIGGMTALFIGFTVDAPTIVLLPLALLGAIIGGAFWAGIAGLLRAKTGAHEVITTIMLNFIALFLTQWLLKTSVFQQSGRSDPVSKPVNEGAELPRLLGSDYRVTVGLLIALGGRRCHSLAHVQIDGRVPIPHRWRQSASRELRRHERRVADRRRDGDLRCPRRPGRRQPDPGPPTVRGDDRLQRWHRLRRHRPGTAR